MPRGFACNVKSTKLPFSLLLLRLLVRLSSSQLWARLSVKQCREGGGDCFSSCASYGSSVKESAQPSPLLPHPLIHKWERWECQKQALNMETAKYTEWCSQPSPPAHTRTSRAALWLQQLVQRPNPAASSLSKHMQMLLHAGYWKVYRVLVLLVSFTINCF